MSKKKSREERAREICSFQTFPKNTQNNSKRNLSVSQGSWKEILKLYMTAKAQ